MRKGQVGAVAGVERTDGVQGFEGFDDESVTRLRVALHRTVRALDRRTNRDDVPRTQMMVLFTIARNGSIPLAELAEFEGINPTMLSRVLGKLEAGGLVRRVPDAEDRRVVHAEVTDAGRSVARQQRDRRAQIFADLLADVPADSLAALHAALPALEAIADVARGKAPS